MLLHTYASDAYYMRCDSLHAQQIYRFDVVYDTAYMYLFSDGHLQVLM